VSLAWRARARRVLCARLCARLGLPLTSNLVEVTELDLSGPGRLIAVAVSSLEDQTKPKASVGTAAAVREIEVAPQRLKGVLRVTCFWILANDSRILVHCTGRV
jgi:hypothetical protein